MLPIDHNISRAKTLLNVVNGVLFSGGNDLSPSFYDERTNDCGILDMKRDKMEMALFIEAVSLNTPILGICRGIQLINVALGGKLPQDLSKDGYPKHSIFSSSRNIATHKIVIERNTLLSNIIGCGEHWVNSFHHQGIKELGKGLICAAKSEEGLIEAIEYPQKKFLMAVQWHPEMMYDDDTQQNIFKYFVDACRKEEL